MNSQNPATTESAQNTPTNAQYELNSRDLLKSLAPYRVPNHFRSVMELIVTYVPFFILWAAAWWALSISYWLTLAICIPAGGFLVRLFLIQHDCGHGAFFRNKKVNDWVGRISGVFTFTPYHVWRHSHAVHHATSGNLDERGTGDIDIMTVTEYNESSRVQKLLYRMYRHPIVLFGIGPAYQFLIRNRLPQGVKEGGSKYWISTMGTNLAIAAIVALMIYLVGWKAFLIIQLPTTVVAASIGVWLFYVQHQFEETSWDHDDNWKMDEAAIFGSTYYDLPKVISWITAHIGVHHVHHLSSRIPYYNLPKVMRDFPELADIRRLTFIESLSCLKLRLWDENQRRLISFAEARSLSAA